VFLGLLQGVTEFLPVSSSGHLVLFQHIFGIKEPELFFDILLHVATLAATVLFFRNELTEIIRSSVRRDKHGLTYLYQVFIATIPTILIGFFIAQHFEYVFASLAVVRIGFMATALILIIPVLFPLKSNGEITGLRAFLIGTVQGLSVIPGLSRSGSTIMTGVISGVNFQSSFTFSFILSIPAIIGATIHHVINGKISTTFSVPAMVLGFLAAFFSGYLSLAILKKVIIKMKMHLFGYYLIALILLTFIFVR
jgi:undecaprenyl-diphosphatase